ncbi:DUF4974 domain-containing protein [Pontibacter sp. 172403-2]|uniref:FecR family protein n=1 Tax=Pontibacter rufus TaxID=2791028 RepID=UPI0018AFDA98|nr:FecR family protein [Pontibacter sp. 172403-2]MBF9252688.1 DUF4974 domain-containing protein [Pontibacter sp. 172403-2]
MNKEEFLTLMHKYLAGEASAAEEEAMFRYYDALQKQESEWDAAQMGEEEEVKKKLYNRILKDIKQREGKNEMFPIRWAIAASILVAMLTSVLFFYYHLHREQATAINIARPIAETDIQAGGNKAILILSDGSKIALDNAANGELAQQGGTCITKEAGGQLTYTKAEPSASEGVAESRTYYNTIQTPNGGQYQVILPDGSKVWLNAGSSLRYPTRFNGKERKVALTGEAYFEVVKNKNMPFLVTSREQVVEVLGTHFNINSYADEAFMKTTLLEGSVKVWLQGTSRPELLEPGQQAVIRYGGNAIAVQPVDVEEAVAWKNGYFMFVDEDLKSIMRRLARWYDVDVVYQGDIEHLKFGGIISRSNSIAQTLRILELTGNVKFKITGRRVTVMP